MQRVNPDTTKETWRFRIVEEERKKPFWNSPWGKGRPSWHIEDIAITEEYFGYTRRRFRPYFPPSRGRNRPDGISIRIEPMVLYWMHTGFLNVKGEKMSKSLNNFITIKELLERYSPEVFRFFVLSTHYRSLIDFSQEIIVNLKKV